jgi:hypothetical protein
MDKINSLLKADYSTYLPEVFVCDGAWAIWNSLNERFNGFTLLEYLLWCFDFIYLPPGQHLEKKVVIQNTF